MQRTHYCGEVDASLLGQRVVLEGWVNRSRDLGGLVFLDLRDREGLVQVVASKELPEVSRIRSEWVLRVEGEVRLRPPESRNPKLPSGEVEVVAQAITVLASAQTPPFPLDASWRGEEERLPQEELRLRYRYLDLRRRPMLERLRLRHRLMGALFRFFDQEGFLYVETPLLTRSTPEGARDFLVPSRLEPGHFYALPQSPQLFKQMLMVAGVDRYFQIARCFRDEDLRKDRQPDFTQLDVEMSFVEEDDLLALNERLLRWLFQELLGQELPPFPRLTYQEAMDRYGSDRPDLRFDLELLELTELFRTSGVPALAQAERVKGLISPLPLSRNQLAELEATARQQGASGLAWLRREAQGLSGGIARLVEGLEAKLLAATQLQVGEVLLLVGGPWSVATQALGQIRPQLAQKLPAKEGFWPLWVTEFPLFELTPEGLSSMHHPFTAPRPEDLPFLEERPLEVRARAYDLVLNGQEIGGGSIRIHDPALQERIFRLLGLSPEEAESKFGFFLEALRYGAPPHGGIAWGLDRLLSLMSHAESIREVIAFPKNKEGRDPLTQAPAPVSPQQLAELGLALQEDRG